MNLGHVLTALMNGRASGPGVPCSRLQSIRAFPEGLEGLGARVEAMGH